jgi:hypothetical protein
MAPIRILQGDLTTAIEDNSFDHQWMLDLNTGEVLFVPSDSGFGGMEEWEEQLEQIEQEPDRYRRIEPIPSRDGFIIMEEFAESLPDSNFRDRLYRALSSRHPFRYFKDVLCENEKVRQQYFAYRDEQLLYHAKRWLRYESIDAELVPYPVKELS